jgi:4-hydroxy-tetrahydrodipicolinate reductase
VWIFDPIKKDGSVPLPIIINGALGKMGSEIARAICSDDRFSIGAAIERTNHPQLGEDYGLSLGKGSLNIPLTAAVDGDAAGTAVVIDFSSPQSTAAFLTLACINKMRIVVGTTGLSPNDYALAEKAARRSAILVSPNMSVGVNLLFSLTELISARLKDDFDIEIIEAHHRFKKDAPSGTARRLGEICAEAVGLPYNRAIRNGRSGIEANDRPKNEIGMHAVRGGDIIGDHTVLFAGMGERIELRHMLHSRTSLARGALIAARWLADREPGYYSMRDALGM